MVWYGMVWYGMSLMSLMPSQGEGGRAKRMHIYSFIINNCTDIDKMSVYQRLVQVRMVCYGVILCIMNQLLFEHGLH